MTTRHKQSTFEKWLKFPLYLWTIVFVFMSLLYVVGLSFFLRDDVIGVSNTFTLSNYQRLADEKYLRVLLNSVQLAVVTTLLCTAIGYPFGYLITRLKPTTRALIMLVLIIPFWTNALIRMYGWRILLLATGPINTFLKYIGIIQRPLKLLYSDGAVLLGMVYGLLPFMILPCYSSVEKMDFSVVEASRDLGASPLKAFFTITVPLTLPGLMTGCVLVFIPSMGLFFINDLLGGSKSVLAGGLIRNLINARDLPLAAALSIVLLSMTGVVIFFQRKLGGSNEMNMI